MLLGLLSLLHHWLALERQGLCVRQDWREPTFDQPHLVRMSWTMRQVHVCQFSTMVSCFFGNHKFPSVMNAPSANLVISPRITASWSNGISYTPSNNKLGTYLIGNGRLTLTFPRCQRRLAFHFHFDFSENAFFTLNKSHSSKRSPIIFTLRLVSKHVVWNIDVE